jgi:hypothetical protein
MKKKIIFLFAILLFVGCMSLNAQDVSFRAAAPNAVVIGDQFRLTYTINVEGATELRVPDLSEFNVHFGPTQSQSRSIQIINGQSSSVFSLTFTYILSAKQEGTFNIAPATIKVKNSTYNSNSLVIKVLPAGQSTNNNSLQDGSNSNTPSASSSSGINSNDVFMHMIVSNRNVYEQEGFLVTFKLYSLYDLDVGNLKFPEFEGFFAQDVELHPQWALENYNGTNYRTAVVKQSVLYPQRSGKITIESGKYEVIVRMRTQRQVRSFFDDFFDSYQDVKKELTTASTTIDVKPLPSGKPTSFSGAVGNYTMKSSISSENIKTNEAVTITLTLSGNGNIKLLKNPEVIFPNDFEIYDPKIDNNNIKTTAAGSNGTKKIEYMVIPRYAGDFEIPAIQFSYFDPKTGLYKTLNSAPFKLHVEKDADGDASSSSPIVSNFSQQEQLKYLRQDIRYIKTSKPHFISNQEIFFGYLTYILAYLIIAILFIIFFIIYRKQVKENANIALIRTKKANKVAIRRLKKAEKLLKENNKEEFYNEVLRAVWGYLSDKLNIPQAQLTKDNVEIELTKYGIDQDLLNGYMDILNTCEFARYAPSQGSDAMDILFKQTTSVIGKMENIIKK